MKKLFASVLMLAVFGIAVLAFFKFTPTLPNSDREDGNAPVDTPDGITYSISTENLSVGHVFAHGTTPDLTHLTIQKNVGGVITEIPIDESMISFDSSNAGSQEVVIRYGEEEFRLSVTVKYLIEFRSMGEVIGAQYALTPSEIAPPIVQVPSDMRFVGWSESIPSVLSGNMVFDAVFEYDTPRLSNITAQYGDTLADLTLPENKLGKWHFTDELTTTVGEVGTEKVCAVEFLSPEGEVLATDSVSVKVKKRHLSFKNVVTEFVYNGERQIPTYTLDADATVIFLESPNFNYTDAATYAYEFVIVDDNYEGECRGTYEIKKANVTVTPKTYSISAVDPLPDFDYTVEGFDEEKLDLLGIEIVSPVINGADEYTLTATASNPNVTLLVKEGTLYVKPAEPDINRVGAPVLVSYIATYEDLLCSLIFEANANGRWAWKNANSPVGDAGDRTHTAVFTHNDPRYEPIEYDIPITVVKKQLYFRIDSTTASYVYDGTAHGLSFTVEDGDGKAYTGLAVTGYDSYTTAGTYRITLSLAEKNYTAAVATLLTIEKATPATDFSAHLGAVWSPSLLLSDVTLESGYAWSDPETKITGIGEQTFPAIYTPEDTVNYKTVEGSFSLTVRRAEASILGVLNTYTTTYNGLAYTLPGIKPSHEETAEIIYTYKKDGILVDAIVGAGDYTVTITLGESEHYLSATATSTVTVKKATVAVFTELIYATYGEVLADVSLPESALGTWTWQDATLPVGDAGEHTHTVHFTPSDLGNYEERDVQIRLTVRKRALTVPSIDVTEFTYTGTLHTSGLTENGLYTVADPGGVTVGTYYATLTLTDSDNYRWSDTDASDVQIAYEITKASVTPPTQSVTTSVYNGQPFVWEMTSNEFYTVTNATPSADVGEYRAIVSLRDTKNYEWQGGSTASITYLYTVTKASVTLSGLTAADSTYGKTREEPSVTVTTNGFTVGVTFTYSTSEDGEYAAAVPRNAGTYFVKATVTDTDNYTGDELIASFTIEKAASTLVGVTNAYTVTYDGNPFTIAGITVDHTESVVISTVYYDQNGEVIPAPLNAGTYTAVITASEADNHLGVTKTVSITVAPKENTDTIPTYIAAYGDTLASPSMTLPESDTGTWAWKETGTTMNAVGETVLTLVFTPNDSNHAPREVTVTVKVEKKAVPTPSVSDKEYNGHTQTSGLVDTELYTVKEGSDLGGIEFGTYAVILVLRNPENYQWSDTADEIELTVYYDIVSVVNSWTNAPSATKNAWTYGDVAGVFSASATFGEVVITYSDGTNTYTTLPTDAGSYKAYFTVGKTDSYGGLSAWIDFVIQRKSVEIPTLASDKIAYTGENITSGISTNEYYTVSDVGSVNVRECKVTITLKSKNYVWSNDSDAPIEYTYEVVKAPSGIKITDAPSWTYQNTAGTPSYTTDFTLTGTVSFAYASEKNGTYTSTVPTTAGTYYVKALYGGDDNIAAGESAPVPFEIEKAAASILGYESLYTTTYNGSVYTLTGITASHAESTLTYAYTKDGLTVSEIKTAGTYSVTVALPESTNYAAASVTLTVTVNKAANTDTIPTYEASYGDLLSTLPLPTSTTGSWSFRDATVVTTVGDIGTNTFTLIFSPLDALNYAVREVNVTVSVGKKTLTVPTAKTPSSVYTGTAITSGLTDTDLYTVTHENTTNVGTHYATLTLIDSARYEWSTTDSISVQVAYTITKAANEWTAAPNTTKVSWVYGTEAGVFSATAKFGSVTVTYSDGTATYTALPTDVGSYTAYFSVADTLNYAGLAERTVCFTIERAMLVPPTQSQNSFIYTGSTIKAGLAASKYYTVTDAGGVTVGTYTATVSLDDKVNCCWQNGTTQDITYTYTITQASATLSGYSFSGDLYKNTLTLPLDKLTATHNGKTVAGSFTYSALTLAVGENASHVTLTFTPSDTVNFKSVTVKIYMTLKTVAKINNETAYLSIEDALNAAVSGDTVWVCPDNSGKLYIMSNITIPTGVTLLLPYGTTDSDRNTNGIGAIHGYKNAPGQSLAGEDLCITKVILAAGKTIHNYGTLEISGILSGGAGGSNYTGQTASSHARLMLEENASVISYSSSRVLCTGFLLETSKDNGSSVILKNGATIQQPFVLRDYRAGNYFYAANDSKYDLGVCPFNRYQLPNVSAMMTLEYGASLISYANLYTQSTDAVNSAPIALIGSESTSLIQLTSSAHSYVTAKYDPSTEICDLRVFGGAKTNGMKLTVYLSLLPVTVNTADFVFPIPLYFKVTLDNNEANGQTEAIFTIDQRFKLLPGASMTVQAGAKLNANELNIYESFTDAYTTLPYPSDLTPAKLIVNGTLVCKCLGGKVYTTATSGTPRVIIRQSESCTTYEISTTKGDTAFKKVDTYQTFAHVALLYHADGTSLSSITNSGYEYKDGVWKEMEYILITATDEYTVSTNGPVYSLDGTKLFDTYDSSTVETKLYEFMVDPGTVITYSNVPTGYYLFTESTNLVYNSFNSLPAGGGTYTWTASKTGYATIAKLPQITVSTSLLFESIKIVYTEDGSVSVNVKYKIGAYRSEKTIQTTIAMANHAETDKITASAIGTNSMVESSLLFIKWYTYYSEATLSVMEDCTIYITTTTLS